MKQVVAVRVDLKMGRGKIAAQVGHACVLAAEYAKKNHPRWHAEWWNGQTKVVTRVNGLDELNAVKRDAIELQIPWSEVTDAGHTQIEAGTVTCVAVGPAPDHVIDRITGGLRLL